MKIKKDILEAAENLPDKFSRIDIKDPDGTDMHLEVYKDGGLLSVRRPVAELNTVLVCEITINPEGLDDIAGQVIIQSTQIEPSSADGALSFRRKELNTNDIPQNGALPTYGVMQFPRAFQVLQAHVNMFIYDTAYYITDAKDAAEATGQSISYYDAVNVEKNSKALADALETVYPEYSFTLSAFFYERSHVPNVWVEAAITHKESKKESRLNFLLNASSLAAEDRVLIYPAELSKEEYQSFPDILLLTPPSLIREWKA